jgi:hypothetical protein
MERINGDANIAGMTECKAVGKIYFRYLHSNIVITASITRHPTICVCFHCRKQFTRIFSQRVSNNLTKFNLLPLRYSFPWCSLFLRYFNGKRRAEQALFSLYQSGGVALRPGMISGTREVFLPKDIMGCNKINIPLWLLGK